MEVTENYMSNWKKQFFAPFKNPTPNSLLPTKKDINVRRYPINTGMKPQETSRTKTWKVPAAANIVK